MPHQPIIMVAPNGARKTHVDHPRLPVSIDETVREAAECHRAGAAMLHAHVRGDNDEHLLDPVRYRKLLDQLKRSVPDLLVQVTTEAVGQYKVEEQAACVYALEPQLISMAVREMAAEDADLDFARNFYRWCDTHDVHVQHIVYDADDVARLFALHAEGVIPGDRLCALYVLGRYTASQQSEPADIEPFVAMADNHKDSVDQYDWFVCAFGAREQDCALGAIELGGHARIGFENNLLGSDGDMAADNAAQITSLVNALSARGITPADCAQAATILGISQS